MCSGVQPSWDNMDKWVLWCGKFAWHYNILSSKPKASFCSHRTGPPVSYFPSITVSIMKQTVFLLLGKVQSLSLIWSCLTFWELGLESSKWSEHTCNRNKYILQLPAGRWFLEAQNRAPVYGGLIDEWYHIQPITKPLSSSFPSVTVSNTQQRFYSPGLGPIVVPNMKLLWPINLLTLFDDAEILFLTLYFSNWEGIIECL